MRLDQPIGIKNVCNTKLCIINLSSVSAYRDLNCAVPRAEREISKKNSNKYLQVIWITSKLKSKTSIKKRI